MNRPDTVISSPLPKAKVPDVENQTPYPTQYFQTVDPDDNVFHVVVLKATYDMTQTNEFGQLEPHTELTALATSDQFEGEPGETPLIYESDYCAFKPKCDVFLMNAIAHAPENQALARWPVAVAVGDWKKIVNVTGPRKFFLKDGAYQLTEPQAVKVVELNYSNALGGENRWPEKPNAEGEFAIHEVAPENSIGKGFADKDWLSYAKPTSYPAPQIELYEQAYTGQAEYPAVSLTPMMKTWEPRVDLAGSYNDDWKHHRWPKLPIDHDYAFWNCTPADQQIDYPVGGEVVNLVNLHPEVPHIRFSLPTDQFVCDVYLDEGPVLKQKMHLDTLAIDMQNLKLITVHRVNVISGINSLEFKVRLSKRENSI